MFSISYLKTRAPLLRWAGWFFGCNILFFGLVGSRYIFSITPLSVSVPNTLNEFIAWFFLVIAFIGQFSLLAFFAWSISALFILVTSQRALVFILTILIATVFVSFFYIDATVFSLFHFHLNGIIWRMVFSGHFKEYFNFSFLEWLHAVFLFLGIFAIEFCGGLWLWQNLKKTNSKFRHGKDYFGILLSFLLLSYYFFVFAGVYPYLSINQQAIALPFYEEVLSYVLPMKNSFSRIAELGNGNFAQPRQPSQPLKYPLHPLEFIKNKKPLNLVIIAIDTWRFDMLNASVTPHITHFAQSAWQFTNHYSGGNSTQAGIFSLFYGLPLQYWTSTIEQHRDPIFIDTLLNQHYQMGVFASSELVSPPFNKNVFYRIKDLTVNTPGENTFERDKTITHKFKQFIQNVSPEKPFFSFLFYDGAHSYCDEGNSVNLFQPETKTCDHLVLSNSIDPVPYLNRYKNALYSVDNLIGEDLALLKSKGLLNNTVILITGDHGEEFNDTHQNYWGHASNYTHYQVQTPLVVYWPHEKPQTFTYQTNHYEIIPTLMKKLLGCQNPVSDYSIGQSLFMPMRSEFLMVSSYVDFAILEKNKITRIYPTITYLITDSHNKDIPGAKPNLSVLKKAFALIRKYYS